MMDIDERQAIRQKHFKDTQGNCDWCCEVENWGSELNHLAVSWPCEVIELLNALELTIATLAVERIRNAPRPPAPYTNKDFDL